MLSSPSIAIYADRLSFSVLSLVAITPFRSARFARFFEVPRKSTAPMTTANRTIAKIPARRQAAYFLFV